MFINGERVVSHVVWGLVRYRENYTGIHFSHLSAFVPGYSQRTHGVPESEVSR